MKRTCDMEIGEKFQQTDEKGIIKNMVITSKNIDEHGFLIVMSAEVTA